MSSVAPPQPSSRHVLLVDYNPDSLDVLTSVLQSEGHEISVARDGIEGALLAEWTLPDLVVCDICIPRFDGFELCQRLRRQPVFDDTTLVVLTGLSDTENVLRAARCGFDYYALKPLDPRVLRDVVLAPRPDDFTILCENLRRRSTELLEWGAQLAKRSQSAQRRARAIRKRR
jgi:CheY-like chemotaxis protein